MTIAGGDRRPVERPRLLLVTQYYAPEVGAPQTRLRQTVAGLHRRGFDVTVVAPTPSYPLGIVPPGYDWWRPRVERIDDAEVLRLPSLVLPGARMSRRLVGQLAFATASLASVARAGRTDVALIESPPLLLAGTARALCLAGAPYVFHVADPWPDFPIALGYLRSPIARRLAYGIEDLAYRGAHAVTTVSPGLVALLETKPSAAGRVHLVPNGVDLDRFDLDADPAVMRQRLGWPDGFTILYLGTVGLAQGVGTLLDAAARLRVPANVRIIGDGVEKVALATRARTMGLDQVVFQPSIPAEAAPMTLAAADAGLVMLRAGDLYEHSLPTKLLETMGAARPVIVSADGLAADIVRDADAGYVAPAEDAGGARRGDRTCGSGRRSRQPRSCGTRGGGGGISRDAVLDRLEAILREAIRP